MDLRNTLAEQITDLITWMENSSTLEPPSPVQHQERCLELRERAWFLREICLPKIPTQKIALANIEGVKESDNLLRSNGFLRGKAPGYEALVNGPGEPSETAQPS